MSLAVEAAGKPPKFEFSRQKVLGFQGANFFKRDIFYSLVSKRSGSYAASLRPLLDDTSVVTVQLSESAFRCYVSKDGPS